MENHSNEDDTFGPNRSVVIFLCLHIKCATNKTQFQRSRYIAREYPTVILSRSTVCPEIAEKAESVTVCGDSSLRKLLFPLWLFWRIWRLNRRTEVEYVHTTFSVQTLIVGYLSKYIGLPWVADIWDDPRLGTDIGRDNDDEDFAQRFARLYNKVLLLLVKRTLHRADLIIIALVPDILQELNVDPKAENVLQVTNGVDLSITTPQTSEPDSAFRVLYLGAVSQVRCVDDVIAAVGRVTDEIPNIRLRLVGDVREQDREWITEYMEEHDVSREMVDVTGFVDHDTALEEVAKADVCLCLLSPSVRNYQYAYPIKVFEYMAMEKPTIATRMLGTQRIIQDGETGVLVPPRNVGDVADALRMLYHERERRETMGRRAAESVEKYSWQRIHDEIGSRIESTLTKA